MIKQFKFHIDKILIFFSAVILTGNAFIAEAAPENTVPIQNVDLGEGRISLDLKGIAAGDLFRIFSLKTGWTIVSSRNIKDRINIFLNDTTYEEALEIILVSQGYAVEKREDFYYVMTEEEYLRRFGTPFRETRIAKTMGFRYADADNLRTVLSELKSAVGKIIVDKSTSTLIILDIPEKVEMLTKTALMLDKPLKTKVYELSYASAEEIKDNVEAVLTRDIGKVVVDERARTLVVTDAASNIAKVDEIVKALDAETQQVYIKTEILQVTLTDKTQQGIEWSRLLKQSRFDQLTFSNDFDVLSSTAADYGRINVGVSGSNSYTAMIELLQEQGDVKILSRPQISVLNNEEARIHVGVEQPFISSTLSRNDTSSSESYSDDIEYKNVGVMLNVKPVIGSDGFITMEINPEISSIKETITTSAGSVIPVLEKSTAQSKVKVKNGSMIMIGGLIKDKISLTEKGVPVLKDIPVLGNLFKNKTDETERTELVIFLTPTLVRGDVSVVNAEFAEYVPGELMPYEYKDRMIYNELRTLSTVEVFEDEEIRGLKEHEDL